MAKKPAGATSRGKLMSMRVSNGFRAFALEQLAGLPGLRDRAMFGGIGLYADDLFFGLIAADVLYLRVTSANRAVCESAGATAFRPYAGRAMTMPYYAVPVSVLEDESKLVEWAKQSVTLAREAQAAKKPRTTARKPAAKTRRAASLPRAGKK